VKSLLALIAAMPVHALAHITGGGLTDNIPRVLRDGLEARLQRERWPKSAIFDWLARTGGIEPAEMYRTFNCGLGMIVVTAADRAQQALDLLTRHGEQAMLIGEVQRGTRGVVIE
jgi:phosphoribosylformylglycinamidine cyclo-ligase